jgi:hypothetical protein
LVNALDTAKHWENEKASTAMAMKASVEAHAVARQTDNPVYKAVARSIGQSVATAHMADHSLGGAFYALKAVKFAKKEVEYERRWQMKRLKELPSEVMDIVETMWRKKELDKKI